MKELFKDLKGYEDYYSISTNGKVFSKYSQKYLKHTINPLNKVHSVKLYGIDKPKTFSVVRLMAITFVHNSNENLYKLPIIKDGNHNNLNIENIIWGTASTRTRLKIERNPDLLGAFINAGTKINTRKMTDSLEMDLVKMHSIGYSVRQLQDIFPIKECRIRQIIKKHKTE
jgi:hypothetical protein